MSLPTLLLCAKTHAMREMRLVILLVMVGLVVGCGSDDNSSATSSEFDYVSTPQAYQQLVGEPLTAEDDK